MTDKINGTVLGMSRVNLLGSNTSEVIDCGVLIAFVLSAVLSSEYQKLNIHLNVVARHFFVVKFSMDISSTRSSG